MENKVDGGGAGGTSVAAPGGVNTGATRGDDPLTSIGRWVELSCTTTCSWYSLEGVVRANPVKGENGGRGGRRGATGRSSERRCEVARWRARMEGRRSQGSQECHVRIKLGGRRGRRRGPGGGG